MILIIGIKEKTTNPAHTIKDQKEPIMSCFEASSLK